MKQHNKCRQDWIGNEDNNEEDTWEDEIYDD